MAFTEGELDQWYQVAKDAALEAGKVLRRWTGRFSVKEKGRFDLVTEADVESQKVVHEFLMGRFPKHNFLGEEGGMEEKPPAPGSAPTWIVDPIDGTSNYAHDFPFYCTSIGLMADGEMVVGAIYDPTRDELFHAARGKGAWINGKRIQPSLAEKPEQSLVTTGFPYNLNGKEELLGWWEHWSWRAQALRRTGSTALNLAYVAAGRCDAFYALEGHAWDVAGGMVLVKEAGGKITKVQGAAFDPFVPNLLATNGKLHDEFVRQFSQGPKGRP